MPPNTLRSLPLFPSFSSFTTSRNQQSSKYSTFLYFIMVSQLVCPNATPLFLCPTDLDLLWPPIAIANVFGLFFSLLIDGLKPLSLNLS